MKKNMTTMYKMSLNHVVAELESVNPNNALLLPAASISSPEVPSLESIQLTAMDRFAVQRIISKIEKRRYKAETEAQIYRNVAEEMKKENRSMKDKLTVKLRLFETFGGTNYLKGAVDLVEWLEQHTPVSRLQFNSFFITVQ